MSQENLEIVRRLLEACNGRDWDAMLETGDSEIEIVTLMGGTYRGYAGWRLLVEQMAEEVSGFQFVPEDLIDVGQDRVVAVTRWVGTGRTSGIAVPDTTIGLVYTLRDGLVVRQESFRNKAEALRAGGVAESAMPENVELVRSISAAHERGDYGSAEWAHPDIEYVIVGGPTPGSWKGRAAMARAAGELFSVWKEHRSVVEEVRPLDGERVLMLGHSTGRGKASGIELDAAQRQVAALYQVRDGRVIRHVVYMDRADALADLGLAE